MQRVPITSDLRQRFQTTLGEISYNFEIWWQPSDENWYFSIDQILSGARIVEGGEYLKNNLSFPGFLSIEGTGPLKTDAWETTHAMVFNP